MTNTSLNYSFSVEIAIIVSPEILKTWEYRNWYEGEHEAQCDLDALVAVLHSSQEHDRGREGERGQWAEGGGTINPLPLPSPTENTQLSTAQLKTYTHVCTDYWTFTSWSRVLTISRTVLKWTYSAEEVSLSLSAAAAMIPRSEALPSVQ